jgi:hypothetical protein
LTFISSSTDFGVAPVRKSIVPNGPQNMMNLINCRHDDQTLLVKIKSEFKVLDLIF